jgi:hypothetical protein
MKRRIISIILLVSIVTMSIGITMPTPVQASTGSVIASAGGCVAGGLLTNWLKDKVDWALSGLQKRIEEIGSKFIKGILGDLVGSLIGGSVPTSDANMLGYFQNKDYRDATIARCLARVLLDNVINNSALIIQTRGRDGGAAFVQNWRTFDTNAQYRGENIFRAMLSTANICPYFANDLRKSFGLKPTDRISLPGVNTRTGDLLTFNVKINCTMPKGFTIQKYQQDFVGQGGWAALVRLSEPQNNPAGAALLAQNEIDRQRELEQTADTNQVLAGRGYVGISGKDKTSSCKIKGFGGACIIFRDIKTTGAYLADSAAATIGAEFSWMTTAQGLNWIIEDVTQNMINRLFDQSDNSGGVIATDPILTIPGVDNTPTPTPGTQPTPPPGEEPASLLSDIQSERAKYGTPMSLSDIGKLLNAVAWKNKDAGWMLLGKSSGANCPAPSGALISCDFLVQQPTLFGYDVLTDAEGAGTPTWSGPEDLSGAIGNGSRTLVNPTQP